MVLPLETVNQYFKYRPEDGALLWRIPPKYHWYLKGDPAGWISPEGVRILRWPEVGGMTYVHRVVWYMHREEYPHRIRLRFVNGDVLDTRIENLELAAKPRDWV
jgi:hypothetical protein